MTGDDTTYEGLYRRWEDEHWSAFAIDFSVDIDHWRSRIDDLQRAAASWNYAMFLTGIDTETRVLPAFLEAAPGEAERTFLATQAVDEARHRVFLERWLHEVAGHGDEFVSTVDSAEGHLTWGFRQILTELERVAVELHKKPRDREMLAAGVALLHVIFEGVLAVPGGYFINRYLEKEGVLPGLATGLAHTQRDEARHVAFGTRLLGDLVRASPDCRSAAIEMWDRTLPAMVGVFVPPNRDMRYIEAFDFTMQEVYTFGLRTFESKIKRIGIEPRELYLLRRDDLSMSYEDRAQRLLVLIETGVIGDDRREPSLTQEALEILFEATTRAVDIGVARSLEGPVQWDFSDAEPWHLVVVDDHIEAKPGRVENAALRLEISAGDWARIAVGRFDPRWALLRRRLRVSGSLSAKAKLSKLFG